MTSSPRELAQRVELHAFGSLTLSDQQFLTGDSDGKPVTMTGEFRIAQGEGRLPTVIMMHGSGGLGAGMQSWVRRINAIGVSTFAIDGFTGRGLTVVGNNQAALGRLNFIVDIFRALALMIRHERVDPDRIAVMGFSRGGQAAIYAAVDRFRKMWNTSGAEFCAYIPFYPDCGTTYLDDIGVSRKPIRVHHGSADDYNSLANARKYATRLKAAGADIKVAEYPGAHHGFDNPLNFGKTLETAGSQAVCNCDIREREPGMLINAATGKPFSYSDACVNTRPHIGGDAEAAAKAYAAVEGFLHTIFGLRG